MVKVYAQRWNDVLHVKGGVLNDIKCCYHLFCYEFAWSGIAVEKGDTFDPVIVIKYNSDGHKK